MKAVLQRVKSASVTVNEKIIGEIGVGFAILLGVVSGDTEAQADLLAKKVAALRVFTDENEKMNLSLIDVAGEALVVSQFTLCACCKKGNRPSFSDAAVPDEAKKLYEYFIKQLETNGVKKVQQGEFGADMLVSINNDGPVTILFDTDEWKK